MTGAQVGSMKWMAPEVMDPEQKSDGYAADRYAMGVRLRFWSLVGLWAVPADLCADLSSSSPLQIIAWEVITLEELYPKMGMAHIVTLVLNRQMRPSITNMSSKFRLLCEVRLRVCVRLFAMSVSVQGCCFPLA